MAIVTLGSKAEGSIIKLNESGNPVEFYIAKKNYESGLNGTGRILVVRKDCHSTRAWNSSGYHNYANGTLDTWFNGTYKNLLDAEIRTAMGTTKFYYYTGNTDNTTTSNVKATLERSVFALSDTELGVGYGYGVGTKVPIASTLQIAYKDGTAIAQWTRSVGGASNVAVIINAKGSGEAGYCNSTSNGARPAFTLPADTLYVDDNGVVSVNTAPSVPASITVPGSIQGGSTIAVSWGASTDAQSNLEGYKVERSTNGGSTWTQIYQGSGTSTTNSVAFGTASVMYRVRAYDREGLHSAYKTSGQVTVINNTAPSAPGSITVPAAVRGGSALSISWAQAADNENNLSGYELERSVNGGSWSQIYKGSALTYKDAITAGWNTVAYRVRAYDTYNATSAYVTSPTRTVDNNAYPVITSSTASGTNLGTKNEGFNLTYTVTDADRDTVTVKEYLDNVLQRTYTATLGASNTFQIVTAANFLKVLNGAHTLKVVANDGKADSAAYTVTFTKNVTSASITLAEPMTADAKISLCAISVIGSIPTDAEYTVEVTNNAKDANPVWEDCTTQAKTEANFIFTNETAANGFAFNFHVKAKRGASGAGGYITSVQGGFQ